MSAIPGQIQSSERQGFLRVGETKRFLRFALVGAGGTFLDFSILSVLKLLGLATLPANTVSYLAGTLNNFYWNRRWTFRGTRGQLWHRQLIQFVLISLFGLLLNNSLVLLLEPLFSGWLGHWDYLPAKILATGVVLFWNYLANRFWTFRAAEREAQDDVS